MFRNNFRKFQIRLKFKKNYSNVLVINPFHSKKSKIQSKNLAPSILEGLMPITTEDEPGLADDDTPSRVCFLSMLAIFTRNSLILTPVRSPNY